MEKQNKHTESKAKSVEFTKKQLEDLKGCGQSQMDWDSTAIIVGIPVKIIQENDFLLNIYLKEKYTAEMLIRLVTLEKGMAGDSASAKQYLDIASKNIIELDFD
jgi:hypothetical protein